MSDMPSSGSAPPDAPPPTVTDRRPVPRGVLPRNVQTWVMVGVAVGMLAIMLVVGRPDPPERPAQAAAPAQPPSADRVRDYQDCLRVLEAQALRQAQDAAVTPPEPMDTRIRRRRPFRIRSRKKRRRRSTKASSPATWS